MNFEMLNKLLFVFILLIIICSCNEEEPTAPTEENLLLSTSFEKNGQASADGWTLPAGSDFSTSVPPNGGSYSLGLNSSSPPGDYAFIKVPVKTQYTINKLTFWAKSTGVSNNVYGKAVLSLIRNGSEIESRSIQIDVIDWRSFSIQDTFSVAAGDSFLVKLSGGISQLLPGTAYFDLCQLQGIK
jgi:hypothetical protein